MDFFPVVSDEYLSKHRLTHILTIPSQAKRCKNLLRKVDCIFLDTGIYEGEEIEDNEYIGLAEEIDAKIICLPDVMKSCDGTIERAERFLRRFSLRRFKTVFCLQGETPVLTLYALQAIPKVDVVAFPRWMHDEWQMRSTLVHFAHQQGLLRHPVHLFGLPTVRELWTYTNLPVVSVDTDLPFKCGLTFLHELTSPPQKDGVDILTLICKSVNTYSWEESVFGRRTLVSTHTRRPVSRM